ncbi:MAG: glycosyltransferase [Gemmatimonadota bacterium]
MKISIAVPSLNQGSFLGTCLESIRTQTHEDFEALIADGGSTDASREIIDEYVKRDGRFRLVSVSDQGQADAVNKALALATGDIHCFLNADDQFLCSDAFEAIVSAFLGYSTMSIVSFTGWSIDERGHPVRRLRLRYHPRDNFEWMQRRTAVVQPATFWRAEVTRRLPFRAELQYAFDSWFFYEAYRAFGWIELEKPVAGARLQAGSKSLGIRSERISEFARLETFKYGPGSWRGAYLHLVSGLVGVAGAIPVAGPFLQRTIYVTVNALAYLSFYRLPSM